MTMGLGFLRLGVPGAALPELDRAAVLAPRNGRVVMFLGYALMMAGRYQEAVGAGRRAVALEPRSAEALYHLGVTFYRPTGKQGDGRDCFRRAVALDPHNALFRRDYGASLVDVGEYAEAERQLRVSLQANAGDPVTHYLLGKTLHRGGTRHDAREEAARELREAIRLSPLTFQPHYELSLLLEEQGDYRPHFRSSRSARVSVPVTNNRGSIWPTSRLTCTRTPLPRPPGSASPPSRATGMSSSSWSAASSIIRTICRCATGWRACWSRMSPDRRRRSSTRRSCGGTPTKPRHAPGSNGWRHKSWRQSEPGALVLPAER